MRIPRSRVSRASLLAVLLLITILSALPAAETTVVRDVRLFDGERVVERATVVFDDRVRTVLAELPSDRLDELADATVVDGRGKTLMPGLIDAHTHSWGPSLEHALAFGVTTVLDMFTDPRWAGAMRAEQKRGGASGRADLFSAGILATATGGHGTQYPVPVPTLATPGEAAEWVAARVAEGSDWIKIIIESGSPARPLPTLDRATVTALIEAAHAQGKMAVAHATEAADARMAIEAGVDGLVHVFHDRIDDAELEQIATLAAEQRVFVVPTLSVLEGIHGGSGAAALAEDPRVTPYLAPSQTGGLRQSFPPRALDSDFSDLLGYVAALHRAGAPILAGTDAPNPGTAFGASLHRELALLVEAGLTPTEALAGATARTADAFRLSDRGRVAAGQRADLLLVEGDPTRDVTDSRSIVAIWKGGEALERRRYDREPGHPRSETGSLGRFDDGRPTAPIGFGWVSSTDRMAGGRSTATLSVREPGVDGSAGALVVTGELVDAFAFPWAGAMLFPASTPMEARDASAATRLHFSARSPSQQTLRVLVFSESLGSIPAERVIEIDPEWRPYSLELDSFPGFDPRGFQGLLFSAGPATGPFELWLDEIALE